MSVAVGIKRNDAARFLRATGSVGAEVDGSTVVLGVAEGEFFELNSVAARIWEILASPTSLDDLVTQLVAEFDVAESRCRAATISFLARAQDRGVVTADPAG